MAMFVPDLDSEIDGSGVCRVCGSHYDSKAEFLNSPKNWCCDRIESDCLHQDDHGPFCGDPACDYCRVGIALLQADVDEFWDWDARGALPSLPQMPMASIAEPTNPDALAVVERYALCELSLGELRRTLRHMLGSRFRYNEKMRWISLNSVCREPAVPITRQHVENALSKRRCNRISDQDLRDWATTILTNLVYYWDGEDSGVISEWVSRLSLDFVPDNQSPSTPS